MANLCYVHYISNWTPLFSICTWRFTSCPPVPVFNATAADRTRGIPAHLPFGSSVPQPDQLQGIRAARQSLIQQGVRPQRRSVHASSSAHQGAESGAAAPTVSDAETGASPGFLHGAVVGRGRWWGEGQWWERGVHASSGARQGAESSTARQTPSQHCSSRCMLSMSYGSKSVGEAARGHAAAPLLGILCQVVSVVGCVHLYCCV